MNASIRRTPGASAASTIRSASAAVMASGFSHRTCLPAAAAAIVHSAWRWFGQRDVHGVDVRIGEQRLVRAVGARDAELVGDAPRRVASRDAIATTSQRARLAHPGDDLLAGDVGGRQDPPAELARHRRSTPRGLGHRPERDLEDAVGARPGQDEQDRLRDVLGRASCRPAAACPASGRGPSRSRWRRRPGRRWCSGCPARAARGRAPRSGRPGRTSRRSRPPRSGSPRRPASLAIITRSAASLLSSCGSAARTA